VKRAFGHRHGYFPTDRALCLQEPGVDATRFNLVRLRVGDEASVQVLAGARSLREERRKLAGRARLSRHDREGSLARRRKGAFGEINERGSVDQDDCPSRRLHTTSTSGGRPRHATGALKGGGESSQIKSARRQFRRAARVSRRPLSCAQRYRRTDATPQVPRMRRWPSLRSETRTFPRRDDKGP
jgi:hypothetical protein